MGKVLLAAVVVVLLAAAPASAQLPSTSDPRANLAPGTSPAVDDAARAELGLDHLANQPKSPGMFDPNNLGNFLFLTSDMAFQGDHAFVGSFNGFNVYDISNPANPTSVATVICPGFQGDMSVFGNLLFMSVEDANAKTDCSTNPASPQFRGVRIFNISNPSNPVQVAGVQTCRGSHTHTLVEDDSDPSTVYIYVSGTSTPRTPAQMAGCDGNNTNTPVGANPTKWRIEVIRVPLAAPQNAAIVNEPRLFANDAGAVNGLQNEVPTPNHPSGIAWSPQPITDACHDITVYEELDIAAGACEGNGLLIDISNPANPRRIDAVADPLWAYWHGATFSNDGRYVIFTDEWGGGTAPRCRATDDRKWGGDAIYEIVDDELVLRSYYKLPVAQTNLENCVSHIPSLVPIPGRDVFVQAFYQGGASLVDFEDPENPREIGYFDRGPVSGDEPRVRRLLVDLLVQRRDVRQRAPSQLRRDGTHADLRGLGQRDRGGARGPVGSPERADAEGDHLGSELQCRALLPRPARAGGEHQRGDARAGGQVRRPRRGVRGPREVERGERSAPRPLAAVEGQRGLR